MTATVPTIQLGEFCGRLDVRDREVRYVLERGFVPKGVERSPSTGNHRQFDPGQAFWLAMVLKLKGSGVKTPLAAKVADYAVEALRGVTQSLNWDWRFFPAKGWFDTGYMYFIDIGDLLNVRILTDSCPTEEGRLHEFDWVDVESHKVARDFQPYVILRLDLSRIAGALEGAGGWQCPYRSP